MTYLSKDNHKRGSPVFLWPALAAIFVLFIILITIFQGPFSGLIQSIGRPIWQIKNSIGQSNFFSGFDSKVKLQTENQNLISDINQYQSEKAERVALINENNSLKEILGRKATTARLLLVSILIRPPQSPYDTFIIDAGADQGVKMGEIVLALGNLATGQIVEVHSTTATVRLFSAPSILSKVLIEGTTTTAAAALGRGGGNFEITLPVGTNVNLTDPVVLPGIPPVLLGNIEKIDMKPNDTFMNVYFKAPVNVSNLNFLQVVLN